MQARRDLVLFGATGFTGRLAAAVASRRGLDLAVAGRDTAALETLAAALDPRPQVLTADVADPASLRAMAARARVVCSTVGPFTELGPPVVEACLSEGAAYLDTTGEQPWIARLLDAYDGPARTAGVVVGPSLAFEVAIGDCAAALAARDLSPVHKVSLVYALRGFAASPGTRASALGVLAHGGWQWTGGRRVSEPPARLLREVRLFDAERPRTVASFPSGEVLTVPLHVGAGDVHTFAVLPRAAALLASGVGPALPRIARSKVGDAARRLALRGGAPSVARRMRSSATVAAVAHGDQDGRRGARTVQVEVRDPYALTAEILVAGAEAVLTGAPAAGVRAPAELLGDPEAFLRSLAPRGVSFRGRDGDIGV